MAPENSPPSGTPAVGSDSLLGNDPATQFQAHELLGGMMTVGGNGSETISETDSPTDFSYYAGSGRDLQYSIEVVLENTADTLQSATVDVTISAARMYDSNDSYVGNTSDAGETVASESQSVDIEAGAKGSLVFFEDTQTLDNRNAHVSISVDNSSIEVRRTNVETVSGTYRTTVDEGGGQVVQDHFGRNVQEIDPLDGAANYPHGLKKEGKDVLTEVSSGKGITVENSVISANIASGLDFDTDGAIVTDIASGLTFDSNDAIAVGTGPGIRIGGAGNVRTDIGSGLGYDGGSISVSRGTDPGLFFNTNGNLEVGAAGGLTKSGGDVGVDIVGNGGLDFYSGELSVDKGINLTHGTIDSTEGLYAKYSEDDGISITGSGQLRAKIGDGLEFVNGTIEARVKNYAADDFNYNSTEEHLLVNKGGGIDSGTNGVYVSAGSGLVNDGTDVNADVGTGLEIVDGKLEPNVKRYDTGDFNFDSTNDSLNINTQQGINNTDTGLQASVAVNEGIKLNGSNNIALKTTGVMRTNSNGAYVATEDNIISGSGGLYVDIHNAMTNTSTGIRPKYSEDDAVTLNGSDQLAIKTASNGAIGTNGSGELGVDVHTARGLDYSPNSNQIEVKLSSGLAFNNSGEIYNTNVASSDGGSPSTAQIESENHHRDITVEGPTDTFELDELPFPFSEDQPGNIQLTPLNRAAGEASWHVAYMRPDALKIDFHSEISEEKALEFRLSLLG